MKCILMNKNTEVLVAEYAENLSVFTKVYEIKNIDYAPLLISNSYKANNDLLRPLSDWFRGRGIPDFREQLDILLARLNVAFPSELLNKAFALSLSDQYWLKPYGSDIKYDNINFFEHDFNSSTFLQATFFNIGNYIQNEAALKTPNNTTDGMLKKSWIIENGKRILVKGDFKNGVLQPFNEVLATNICSRLDFNHAEYTIDIINDNPVSKCECFINKDTELIPAYQILNNISDKENAYEKYLEILETHNIKNAREKIENMFILDFLIMNEDRHLNNFGIIRDVNTLKWLDIAPIFDNGQALNLSYYNEDEVIIAGEGRFFYDIRKFDDIIKVVKNIKRINISKLDGVVKDIENLLHIYQKITNISDKKINVLCILLNR